MVKFLPGPGFQIYLGRNRIWYRIMYGTWYHGRVMYDHNAWLSRATYKSCHENNAPDRGLVSFGGPQERPRSKPCLLLEPQWTAKTDLGDLFEAAMSPSALTRVCGHEDTTLRMPLKHDVISASRDV